jgi:SAM-dependent methyltransferase
LWLTEWLAQALPLKPAMRVLDLGCGKALSSIFLASEFGVQVWAADLWISPEHNQRRIEAAGMAESVFPLRAEAHSLPFSSNFFDVIVSIDAYQYFGTDVLYLGYLLRFLKIGGFLGFASPGLTRPIRAVPGHLACCQSNGKPFWEDECWSFKTAQWWEEHWKKTSGINHIHADTLSDGCRHWLDFEKIIAEKGKSAFPSDAEALEQDQGKYLGFVRVAAKRTGTVSTNLYDQATAINVGIDK